LLTRTSTVAPLVPAGTVQVSVVLFTTVTSWAGKPPKVTVFVPGESTWKPEPVSCIVRPPTAPPVAGEIAVRVGRAW
jgi:hypothetical protein